MSVMVASTLSLMESLFIVFLHHKHGRPPKWLRKFAFVYLARVFCARDEVPEDDEGHGSKVDIKEPHIVVSTSEIVFYIVLLVKTQFNYLHSPYQQFRAILGHTYK